MFSARMPMSMVEISQHLPELFHLPVEVVVKTLRTPVAK